MRAIMEIDMIAFANEMLNTFHFNVGIDGTLDVPKSERESYKNAIVNYIDSCTPDLHVVDENDYEQINDDLDIFLLRELSNRLHQRLHKPNITKEERNTLFEGVKEYFIYAED